MSIKYHNYVSYIPPNTTGDGVAGKKYEDTRERICEMVRKMSEDPCQHRVYTNLILQLRGSVWGE